MGSRIRENPDKIFECFLEIVAPSSDNKDPWIIQKFPDAFNKEDVLKTVSQFAYPCHIESSTVQHFSFVLTNIDSKWTFGYCRYAPSSPTCFCILSFLPWHETFYKLLDRIAEVTRQGEDGHLGQFVESVYRSFVPFPGSILCVRYDGGNKVFEVPCPDHRKLPSFPENRNLNEYYSAVDVNNMILIFASMLNERRVIITSSKLGRLSACVQAAAALIYPMQWQHIFIPVLPLHLTDYLSAPMPFLIGVPTPVFERARRSELGDVVILYADTNKIESPFDDLHNLPLEVVSGLKRKLKNTEQLRGDGIAKAFLQALVQIIGGYREALIFRDGEQISFCRDTFVETRPNNVQPYLEKILQLQIFQQFIEERLELLNSGKGLNDIFEECLEAEKSGAKFKTQYKDWMANMKKEGGALLRTVKSKTNPAVKHAYKHMKDKSKKAYKEVRSMFQEPMPKDAKYSPHPSMMVKAQPRSAPSSPTSLVRPNTIHGSKLSRSSSNQRSVVSYVRPREGQTRRTVNGRIDVVKKQKSYSPLESGGVGGGGGGSPSDIPRRDESLDSLEERSSSPDLNAQRINMDLMGDLQDLIFRRCSLEDGKNVSLNNVPRVDRTLKPHLTSVSRTNCSPVVSVATTTTMHFSSIFLSPPPIPPPRSKKESKDVSEDRSPNTRIEVPLIRLDSEESDLRDIVFDPLLSVDDVNESRNSFSAEPTRNIPFTQGPNSVMKPMPQRFTVSVQNPIIPQTPTSPLSPGLNNPVYFHVTPVVPFPSVSTTVAPNQVLLNGGTNVLHSQTVFSPSNETSHFKRPFGTPAKQLESFARFSLDTNSMASTTGSSRQGRTSPSSNLLNNNHSESHFSSPTSTNQFGILPNVKQNRFSAMQPQESFLHSRAATSSMSVGERTKLFEDLVRWDQPIDKRVNNSVHQGGIQPNVSSREQPTREQWQTFD